MSRHLIIRCDAPRCDQQTETNASDTAPTGIDVPSGWLTLTREGLPHRHFCSEACLVAMYAPAPAPASAPMSLDAPASAPRAGKRR